MSDHRASNPDATDLSGSSLDHEAAARLRAAIESDDVLASDSDSPPESPRVPGYRIGRLIGQGAGGTVWLAVRDGSEQAVALKVLRSLATDRRASRRAWRELDILSQIRLPCVPHLFDFGTCNDRLYMATEYIEGASLTEHIDAASPSLRERITLLVRVARCVQLIHERGVIHRDLKPANILVSREGEPSIVDLGVATLLSGDLMGTLTEDGTPIGSPAFMAPEQARGDRDQISTRSDVYALGAIGFLLTTGQPPQGESGTLVELVGRVGHMPAPTAASITRDLDPSLAAVLDKAVAFRASDRYSSAAEFADDLDRWLNGEQVEAANPGIWVRSSRWIGRHPVIASSMLSVVVAITIVGGTAASVWWLNTRPATLVFDNTRGMAQLLSHSGRTIKMWESTVPRGLVVAEVVETKHSELPDRVIVVAWRSTSHVPEGWGIEVVNFARPEHTIWSTDAQPEFHVPEDYPHEGPAAFMLGSAIVADVFEESPGPEIAAVFNHYPMYPSVMRVFALTGEVLFEMWHPGWLYDLYWMDDTRAFMISGVNNEGGGWGGRGVTTLESWATPRVLFQVSPEYGNLNHQSWITTVDGQSNRCLDWYKCLWPADLSYQLGWGPTGHESLFAPVGPYLGITSGPYAPLVGRRSNEPDLLRCESPRTGGVAVREGWLWPTRRLHGRRHRARGHPATCEPGKE